MRLALLITVALAAGCSDDTEIVGELFPEAGAVRVLEAGHVLGNIAVLDGHVLVSTSRLLPPKEGPWDETWQGEARWLDSTGGVVGSPMAIGIMQGPSAGASVWVTSAGALHAQSWAVQTPFEPDVDPQGHLSIVRIGPPPGSELVILRGNVDVSPPGVGANGAALGGAVNPGRELLFPGATSGGEVLFPVSRYDAVCGEAVEGNRRLYGLFATSTGALARRISWEETACDPGSVNVATNYWAVATTDGRMGLLYRPDTTSDLNLRWTLVDPSGRATPPRPVGKVNPTTSGSVHNRAP